MHATKKLWTWLAIICLLSFSVLGWVGREIYLKAPPIARVVDDTGAELYSAEQVKYGQSAWLSAGVPAYLPPRAETTNARLPFTRPSGPFAV